MVEPSRMTDDLLYHEKQLKGNDQAMSMRVNRFDDRRFNVFCDTLLIESTFSYGDPPCSKCIKR